MKLGKMLERIVGAKKAAREMRQILEDDGDQMEITISREVLADWFRKTAELIGLVETFNVE